MMNGVKYYVKYSVNECICYDLSAKQGRFAAERSAKADWANVQMNVGTFDTLGTLRRV